MERPTCKTCPYWVLFNENSFEPIENPSEVDFGDDSDGVDVQEGECRRYPKQHTTYAAPHATENRTFHHRESQFPDCCGGDWCGEHPKFPEWIESTNKEAKNKINADQQLWPGPLSTRTYNAIESGLEREATLDDLLELTTAQLLTFRCFGEKALHEVRSYLATKGLHLKNDELKSRIALSNTTNQEHSQ